MTGELYDDVSLGTQLPALLDIAQLPVLADQLASVRRRHSSLVPAWLEAGGCARVADILELTPAGILGWQSIGVGKLDQILGFLTDLAAGAPEILAVYDTGAGTALPAYAGDTALETLVAWGRFAVGARTWGEVEQAVEGDCPDDVRAALVEVRGRALGPVTGTQPTADNVLAGWLASLDDRDRAILRGRLVGSPARTLADIGDEYDVSRERIRQIQTRLVGQTELLWSTESWQPVRWEAFAVRHRFGAASPLSLGELADLASFDGFPRALVLWLAGYTRNEAGVAVRGFRLPELDELARVDDGLVVDEAALHVLLQDLGVAEGLLDWATDQIPGLTRVDDRLVVWGRSVVDKACAVLEIRQSPMAPEAIVEAVGGGSVRSLRQRLYEDPRLSRATRSTVGLASWGGEVYTSITELMCASLEEHGSRALTDIQTELASRYDASPASISMYAAAPIFVLDAGVLRLRGNDEPYQPRRRPARVRGLFRAADDTYIWNLVADHDLLRGSGRALPEEIGVFLGVEPGTRVKLHHPTRDIPVSWPETSHVGPQLGSLKALADQAGADEGDTVHVVFGKTDRSIGLRRRPDEADSAETADRLAWLTGLPMRRTGTLADLALALQCAPEDSIESLRRRGDEDAADLARLLTTTSST